MHGEALHFSANGDAVALALGAARAQQWMDRIRTPPPTLAAKLGVSAATPAAVSDRLTATRYRRPG